ncbi:TetR/AcrR family transcriptional regulator [Kribbella albertanoniae]|uniref:TetR/AcrR family transcriptional regulator n=1 Tax=Kribbella albertanoniae TaxID=1266829 RepID=A0A4R4Q1Q0_9ACTN|nr:TetR/AcrR family transcriptional regulator [Kribbella albertanoniae]TDC28916.1 TetR/AcrR family transcriptional regulator [Kribbella albertanoniae]
MSRDTLLGDAVEYFAKNGIGDASLRGIAAGIGTSHRMLIYHFGSREGLLAEVVRTVEQQQRDLLEELTGLPVAEQSEQFWRKVTEATLIYGPLFFELSAHAMRDRPHTAELKADLINVWLPPLVALCIKAGIPADEAPTYARLGLAASRGLLFDLLLTGDRAAVDEASKLLNRLFGLPQ